MDWEEKDNALHKTFIFKDFITAISFMNSVAKSIDEGNHHPEWTNVYNRLTCRLTTHDAGNTVTAKDHELSRLLDQKYQEFTT